MNMALNHTVMISEEEKESSKIEDVKDLRSDSQKYEAASPDELSIVNAAKYFGVLFYGR